MIDHSRFEGATPGPWLVAPVACGQMMVYAEGRNRYGQAINRLSVTVFCNPEVADQAELFATGRLIAAAPELLADNARLAARVAELEAAGRAAVAGWCKGDDVVRPIHALARVVTGTQDIDAALQQVAHG